MMQTVQIRAFVLVQVYRCNDVFGDELVIVNIDGMRKDSSRVCRYTKSFGS